MSWRSERRTAHERGYGVKWQRARLAHLSLHPLCVYCERDGVVKAATVVDHIKPHKGDYKAFWDEKNWQSLCKTCHDSEKQKEEKNTRIKIGDDGYPEGW